VSLLHESPGFLKIRATPARFRRLAWDLISGMLAAALLGVTAFALAGPPAGAKSRPQAAQNLERFRNLSPAERLRLVEQLPGSPREYVKVVHGDVTLTIIERGAVEDLDRTPLISRVRFPGKPQMLATIKWIIEDGTAVKKGDKVVELDDSALRDMLQDQALVVEQARAAHEQAVQQSKRVQREGQIDVRLAEIDATLAEIDLKKLREGRLREKQVRQLKLERAKLLVERARAQAQARDAEAEKEVRARNAVLQKQQERKRDIEEQIKRCVLKAPRDGRVIYFAPEHSRVPIMGEGEPVREGQILVLICNLKRLAVDARIPEGLIEHLRPGQPAKVVVDAFPVRILSGKVTQIATAAVPTGVRSDSPLVFPVEITLTDKLPRLMPGMSAEVRIDAGRRPKVLQVPVQALSGSGKQRTCFVKTRQGIEDRAVTVGLVGDQAAEVTQGLAEGEAVLRDPRGLAGRLTLPAKKTPR
jgi:RND family efflux transporter MFP subunit